MNLDKHRLTKNILVAAIMGASSVQVVVPPSLVEAANSVVANDTVPVHGEFITGGSGIINANGDIKGNLSVSQTGNNAVIKWNDFSIGANATVDFSKLGGGEFSTLNYVKNGGDLSQIYGTINANEGNIFIVNPAGVEIGNSAQINVGSLYVSNKNLTDDQLKSINPDGDIADINKVMGKGISSGAELMSLGNINATNVTFDGDRIVLDVDRIRKPDEKPSFAEPYGKYDPTQLKIYTTDKDKVIVGYTDQNYTEKSGYSDTVQKITVNEDEEVNAYKWVKDYEQLQAIGKEDNHSLGGNFALRNSIDANGKTFTSIGNNTNKFTGNFDGVGYNIYGLKVDKDNNKNNAATGLFGVVDGATIGNVNLISGTINGSENTGALIGKIDDSGNNGVTKVENILNTAQVTGGNNVGGIIGSVTGQSASKVQLSGLINTGAVSGETNVGGLVGSMENAELIGTSYNLADISGKDNSSNNIGGLVGSAKYATIGNDTAEAGEVYNHLDVTGGYNVGGIVGSMENSTVQNVSNDGNVKAMGSISEEYIYHKGQIENKDEANEKINTIEQSENVQVANVGGIVGNSKNNSIISDVINEGDISTAQNTKDGDTYYIAGNVGGVVGRAEDTNIINATNKEANIRGAHNVGGIAGYFGGTATLENGINNGGDILATGARLLNDDTTNKGFATEKIRPDGSDETFNIGNMGGIVGYMYGDNTHITGSANRGTVHSADIEDFYNIKESSKAANVGGIVGKIDRSRTNSLDTIKTIGKDGKEVLNTDKIAVSNSYNTGDVSGYTGIGGVVGMMYNGEVAGSYNLGAIESTRISTLNSIEPLNMGGVIGDATERANASALIYDVYNKGQIGRDDFGTYGRHVGGIVGRLSGNVEKAYNNGAIYNGFTTVGGIAGWWVDGSINNVFNTGNITVNNKSNNTKTWSEVGGIAGAVEVGTTALSNAYNLGTIRSFKSGDTTNRLGGIIGNLQDFYNQNEDNNLSISNVYTLGNLYVNEGDINSIIGGEGDTFIGETTITNAYYIAPEKGSGFNNPISNNNANKTIAYENRLDLEEYAYEKDGIRHYLGEKENNPGIKDETSKNSVDESYDWRIYKDKTTPILNAFIPNTEEYLSKNTVENVNTIQYGTAYDPLLTIINATGDVNFDWQKLGMSGDAGLAVYGGGLTLNNFKNIGGTGFFGGIIYTDGNLNITNVQENVDTNTDIRFGSSSKIYGSSISISADGNFEGYGDIIATGNNNGTGDISLSGDNVNIYGKLQSAKNGGTTSISGVEDTAHKHGDMTDTSTDIKDPNKAMTAVEERYTHKVTSNTKGDITVTANNGDVNIYYGNEEKGFVDTEGNLNITANFGNVYVDSDLNIKGNLEVTSPNETVIDITNIGKVQNKDVKADEQNKAIAKTMHEFLHSFYKNPDDSSNEAGAFIFHTGKDADKSNVKITVDLWKDGKYDLDKYTDNEHSLVTELEKLDVRFDVRFNGGNSEKNGAANITYIWVADGAQLNGISSIDYKNYNEFKGKLNFALKNDINATDIKNYQSIGGTNDYNGKFDGRDNRIIGLNTDGDGNSLFGTIGGNGQVKNLKVYSSNFDTNGAVAGTNNGIIDNVTGLGNHVTGTGTTGAVGGLVGTNSGTISSSTDRSSVTVGTGINSVGGLAGNNSGAITDSSSNSAVIGNNAENIGGVVGSNTGTIDNADSLGITNGASNVGGIVGSNKDNGAISNVYNESIVIGSGNNIGGVAGINNVKDDKLDDDEIKGLNNVANAGDIKATDGNAEYIGGIIGDNNGTVDGGRNNARIEGNRYVGGIVGNNGENSDLHNITNDSSAFIVGEEYVGGIAGSNEGTITGEDINADESKASLINRGTITGQQYVGGVAGKNTGTIDNINSDISLNVKEEEREAKYFGGIAGHNAMSNDNGTIKKGTIKNATNTADVTAEGASYVGGIVGQNDGILSGEIGNEGNVIGKDYVGGVAGQQNNTNDISGTEDKHRIFTNSGTVEATNGGAGGIFGENTGNLTYVEMTNSGTVTGTDGRVSGTGGLIGVNSGNIKYSSLKNEVGGNVSGVNNVGGLIGINTGEIEGGRDKGGNYYKYQIYNNGTITGTGNGFNIGGLIGENQAGGSLTAGYNTGAISAENSTNVGGIIGSNAGTVDQVYSVRL